MGHFSLSGVTSNFASSADHRPRRQGGGGRGQHLRVAGDFLNRELRFLSSGLNWSSTKTSNAQITRAALSFQWGSASVPSLTTNASAIARAWSTSIGLSGGIV